MAKEYFSHDYGTRNKIKLAALLHKEKARGYGLFWVIVELLYEDDNKWMDLEQYTYIAIEKESGEDAEYVQGFIDRCINVYKVFIQDGNKFTTERVLRNIEKREEETEKKKKAGKASAEARRLKSNESVQTSTLDQNGLTPVEHVFTEVEHNATKEIKSNQIKGNETKVGNRANALVAVGDESAGRELKKEYCNLVDNHKESDKTGLWLAISGFIKEKGPPIIEPYADAWNLFAGSYGLPTITAVSDSRRRKFTVRIREPEFKFLDILEKIKTTPHLRGKNDQGWKVTFDWLFENDKNYLKILEGNYN